MRLLSFFYFSLYRPEYLVPNPMHRFLWSNNACDTGLSLKFEGVSEKSGSCSRPLVEVCSESGHLFAADSVRKELLA